MCAADAVILAAEGVHRSVHVEMENQHPHSQCVIVTVSEWQPVKAQASITAHFVATVGENTFPHHFVALAIPLSLRPHAIPKFCSSFFGLPTCTSRNKTRVTSTRLQSKLSLITPTFN